MSFESAVRKGNWEEVKQLLENGADPNTVFYNGTSPLPALWWAAVNGHAEVVNALLAAEADLNAAIRGSWTLLGRTVYEGHVEVVKVLLAAGVDPNERLRVSNYTPLMRAAESCKENTAVPRWETDVAPMHEGPDNHVEIANALLAAGADPNAAIIDKPSEASEHGWTALMGAAKRGNFEFVKVLLAAGADPNATYSCAPDSHGWTALMEAVKYGHAEIVKLLLSGGAYPNQAAYSGVPIDFADHNDAIKTTALHLASSPQNPEIISILEEAGAKQSPCV